jgi:hypothetical protein
VIGGAGGGGNENPGMRMHHRLYVIHNSHQRLRTRYHSYLLLLLLFLVVVWIIALPKEPTAVTAAEQY